MSAVVNNLLNKLKDPMQEMSMIRNGLKMGVVESFLLEEELQIKDILEKLHISSSTYFARKRNHQPLDSYASEKFIRLINVMTLATEILGKAEAKQWLYRPIPSLGKEIPLNLLDTEIGHRLVEQALLQIKYGIYG